MTVSAGKSSFLSIDEEGGVSPRERKICTLDVIWCGSLAKILKFFITLSSLVRTLGYRQAELKVCLFLSISCSEYISVKGLLSTSSERLAAWKRVPIRERRTSSWAASSIPVNANRALQCNPCYLNQLQIQISFIAHSSLAHCSPPTGLTV